MVALGFLAGYFLARNEAQRKGLDATIINDLFIYIFVGAIIGARLWFILFYWPADEPRTLLGMLAIWNGGMAFFGGFLGALVGGSIFTRSRQLSFWNYADTVAPGLVLGHAIGRIGCYLVGLHIGVQTTVPWALYMMNGPFQGQTRHPIVLYEISYLLVIFGILWFYRYKWTRPGTMATAYVFMYGIARFVNDFFRDVATDPVYWGLTATQYGLAVLVLAGAVYFLRKR